MAFKTKTMVLAIALFGVVSYILGIIAENYKPPFGTPIPSKGGVICKFPADPTVALGVLSVVALFFCSVLGFISIFYPYNGVKVPREALFQSTTLVVFIFVALGVSVFGGVLTLWATIDEGLHHINNVHDSPDYACPTAKTGLFGGAAFLNLDACLFWLVCIMLTINAREDHLNDDDPKGQYGQVLTTTDYESNEREYEREYERESKAYAPVA